MELNSRYSFTRRSRSLKSTRVSYNKNLSITQRLCNLCHSSLSTLRLMRQVPSSLCWSYLFLSAASSALVIGNWILLVMQLKTNGKKTAFYFSWDKFLIQFTVQVHKYLCMREAQREDWETRSDGLGSEITCNGGSDRLLA